MSSDRIECAFTELDSVLANTASERDSVISILKTAIGTIKLDFGTDTARVTEVKLAALKTFDDLLKSQENLSMAKVKLALSNLDTETNKNVSDIAIEILKRINMNDSNKFNGPGQSEQSIADNSDLERAAAKAGVVVLADETGTEKAVTGKQPVIDQNEFKIEEE